MKDLSFTLEVGETLAIVGYNGSGKRLTFRFGCTIRIYEPNQSGKSTLANILLRILEFDQGDLLMNGVSIKSLSPTAFHTRVSAVFQGFSKYNASVQENIGYGYYQDLQDLDAIEFAAELAGANELLSSLPTGIKTVLEASGHNSFAVSNEGHQGLSGGEVRKRFS